jgi:hypothetical protein
MLMFEKNRYQQTCFWDHDTLVILTLAALVPRQENFPLRIDGPRTRRVATEYILSDTVYESPLVWTSRGVVDCLIV